MKAVTLSFEVAKPQKRYFVKSSFDYNFAMKLLRILVVFAISLTLPLVASSAIFMEIQMSNCPMQAEGSDAGYISGHDCCDPGKAGKSQSPDPCKSGLGCKVCTASGVAVANPARVPTLPQAGQLFTSPVDTVVFGHDPSGLWRPPRSL